MNEPFVAPAKVEMLERVRIAIDQAGFELVESSTPVDLPAESGHARLKGDAQSLDDNGTRCCYYIRPGNVDAVPKWLANLMRASHGVPGVAVYMVVEAVVVAVEKACQAAGGGLLLLTEDNEFEQILNYETTLPEALDAEFEERATGARRTMELKFEQAKVELNDRRTTVVKLTTGMDPDTGEKYAEGVEGLIRIWDDWSFEVSRSLDKVHVSRNMEELTRLEALIGRGPELPDELQIGS
jgi:hypothetical protein